MLKDVLKFVSNSQHLLWIITLAYMLYYLLCFAH
jgi:hypothetical protein